MSAATSISRSLVVALVGVAFVGCSSGGDPASGGPVDLPASSVGEETSAASGGPTGTTGDTGAPGDPEATDGSVVVRSPDSFADYYRKLGVPEPVVTCYVGALDELGVTSLDQMEADQALGARAAERFDRCVAEAGGAGTGTTPTT